MNKDRQGELKDISPLLYSSNIEHPFCVDESYFVELEENLRKRVEEEQKTLLEHIIPAQRQHVFEVPADYFEKSPQNILARVQNKNHHVSKVIKLKIATKKVWLAAASIVILIGLTFGLLMRQPLFKVQDNQYLLSGSPSAYSMLEDASEVDESTIIAMLIQEEAAEQQSTYPKLDDLNNLDIENLLFEAVDIDPEFAEFAHEVQL